MANVSLSTGELKKALLFVSLTTVSIGALVGLVRHYAFGADPTAALAVGLLSGASWSVLFSTWALRRTWIGTGLPGQPDVQSFTASGSDT